MYVFSIVILLSDFAFAGRESLCITSGTTVARYPIEIIRDTTSLIENQSLDSLCAGLWVERVSEPIPALVSLWIEPETCNTTQTRMWINAGDLDEEQPVALILHWGTAPAPEAQGGALVFPFFDDFIDEATSLSMWNYDSDNDEGLALLAGDLVTNSGVLLWSKDPVFGPTDELVARIGWSYAGPNVEIGAGTVMGTGGGRDRSDRSWEGFVHYGDREVGGIATVRPPDCNRSTSSPNNQVFASDSGDLLRVSVRWWIDAGSLWSSVQGDSQTVTRGPVDCYDDTASKSILLLPDEEQGDGSTDPDQHTAFVFVHPISAVLSESSRADELCDRAFDTQPADTSTSTHILPPFERDTGVAPSLLERAQQPVGCQCATAPPLRWAWAWILTAVLGVSRLRCITRQ